MKTRIYLAINNLNEGFICEATNKKQMRAAGMNMSLDWEEYPSYNSALNELKRSEIPLKRACNVSNYKF